MTKESDLNNIENIRKSKSEWQKRNKEYRRILMKNYRKKYPNKIHAHNISYKIPLNNSCEICGSKEKLERHHWNYDKPKVFNTLCNYCHNVQHHKIMIGVLN